MKRDPLGLWTSIMNIAAFVLIVGGWWVNAPDQSVSRIHRLLESGRYAELEEITPPEDRWALIFLTEADLQPAMLTWADWLSGVRRFRTVELYEDGPLAEVVVYGGHIHCPRRFAEWIDQGPRVLGNGRDQRLANRLRRPDGWLKKTIEATPDDDALISKLLLTTLNRRPTDEERLLIQQHFDKENDRRLVAEDIVWSLLRTNEFLRPDSP